VTANVSSTGSVVFWVLLVGILAVLGGMAVMRLRKHLLARDAATEATGWTLRDLEQMRQSGQITEQEFKILRDRILEAVIEPTADSAPRESISLPKLHDNT